MYLKKPIKTDEVSLVMIDLSSLRLKLSLVEISVFCKNMVISLKRVLWGVFVSFDHNMNNHRSKFAKVLAIAGSTALLTACAAPLLTPGVTKNRINDELGRAVNERKGGGIDTALMPPLKIEMPKIAAEVDSRFDLSVVGAPAGQVFMALVSGTRYSMLLPPELSGNITLNLKDVTIREALDTIRELYGFEYKVQGTRIFIQPNSLQSRVFQINYLASKRQGSSDLRISGSGGSSGAAAPAAAAAAPAAATPGAPATPAGGTATASSDTGRVSTTSDADFWRDLTAALNSIVGTSDGRSVILNAMSGVLVVRGFPSDLRNVENYLKATRLVVERQVMLEAKILAVTLSNGSQSGINWSLLNTISNGRSMVGVLGRSATLNTDATLSSASGGGALKVLPGKGGTADAADLTSGFAGLALQTANFAALISFLETQGDVAVLSSPRIATLNNQKALLKVGTDDMYIVNITPGTAATANGAATPPTPTFKSFFSGISLDVTPQIDDEGNIILHVHPAVSQVTEVTRTFNLGSGANMTVPFPSSSVNESDSIVRVQDGNIVAIGGLMRQTQTQNRSQLQGAGDAPIGNLLGQRDAEFSKTEMVVLIKPTIINSDQAWQDDLQSVRDRVQAIGQQKPQAAQINR